MAKRNCFETKSPRACGAALWVSWRREKIRSALLRHRRAIQRRHYWGASQRRPRTHDGGAVGHSRSVGCCRRHATKTSPRWYPWTATAGLNRPATLARRSCSQATGGALPWASSVMGLRRRSDGSRSRRRSEKRRGRIRGKSDVIRLNLNGPGRGLPRERPVDGDSDPIALHRLGMTAQIHPNGSSVTLVWPTCRA